MVQERIADMEKVLKILITILEKHHNLLLYDVGSRGQDALSIVKLSAEIRDVTGQLIYLNSIKERDRSGTNNKV